MTVHSVRGLRAFRHRNYQLFFGGQLISLVGTWMQQVAQAWLVLELTNDVFWLGVVAAAQFVPVLVFGLFGGVLADALPKRQTIFVVQAVMMVLAAILAVLTLTGVVEVWMIIVLALLLGTANAIDMPVRQSFVVEIVGRGDIGNAVVLNSAMFNAARIVGPAVAGLTIGAFGTGTAFAINAASFAAVLVALAAMDPTALRTPELPPRPRSAPQVIEQLREGIGYVRHTPPVLLAILIIGLVSTFGMNFTVVIPALARDVLGTDASGYGFLMAASGVGSLIAAVWLAVSGGLPRVGRMVGGAIALGLAEVLLAVSNLFSVSVLLMVIVGFGGITMAATANTMIQLNVPDALRGRAMSFYTTVFAGSTPVGGILFGWLASAAGVTIAVAVGGIGAVVTGLGAFLWVRRQTGFVTVPPTLPRRAEAQPTETRPADAAADVPPRSRVASSRRWSVLAPARAEPRRDSAVRRPEHDGSIQAAEPERRRQHAAVGPGAALAEQHRQDRRDVGVGVVEVHRRWRPAIPDRERGDGPFDCARCPERVAVVGLRATHRDARRPFPECQGNGPGFGNVTDGRRRGVRVHVVDLGAVHAGVLQRDPGRTASLAPVGPRLDHVVRVGGRPVAEQFRVRLGAARSNDVLGFEHEPRDPLAHDEAVAIAVEGPGGTLRRIVVGRRERPDDVEGTEREGAQGHLAAPGNRRIDPAVAQISERLAERHAARRARVGRRQDRAAHVERDPEVGRGRAAEHGQREVRRHLADALVHVPLVL